MQRFCHRALLLERGSMVHIGDTAEVADRYLELNFSRQPELPEGVDGLQGDGDARVLEVWLEDEEGRRLSAAPQGARITLRALVQFHIDVEDPEAGVHIHNEDQKAVMIAATWLQYPHSGRFASGERVIFSFTFQNVLAPGRYSPVIVLGHRGSVVLNVSDRFERGFTFPVTATAPMGGIVDVPTEVTIERADSAVAHEVEP
jgi:ABC-2 type transport system ATP-binding protein